jgi:hypothetical protein
MHVLFGDGYDYARLGLAAIAVGMGFHLTAGTLTQAALAEDKAGRAAVVWLSCGAAFVAWMVAGPLGEVARTEVGYMCAAAVLCTGLWMVVRERLSALRADAVS